jgi:hypothetical protein
MDFNGLVRTTISGKAITLQTYGSIWRAKRTAACRVTQSVYGCGMTSKKLLDGTGAHEACRDTSRAASHC